MDTTPSPLIQLQALRCERDERVLFQALNFAINAGDVVQVEGPNGSGKTTLLRLLATVSADCEGDILWRGEKLAHCQQAYLQQLLYIGHLPGIKKGLTPRENLSWFAGLGVSVSPVSIESALEAVGLFGYEDVPCFQLSAGQLRRVALARLYLSKAPVWILDEPFTAIDKQGVARLEQLLADHARRGGCVLLTTHQDIQMSGVKRLNLLEFKPMRGGAGL